ncbi:MAG: outer membrane beta-barrel protein, partial [Bacteroidota bacterium]
DYFDYQLTTTDYIEEELLPDNPAVYALSTDKRVESLQLDVWGAYRLLTLSRWDFALRAGIGHRFMQRSVFDHNIHFPDAQEKYALPSRIENSNGSISWQYGATLSYRLSNSWEAKAEYGWIDAANQVGLRQYGIGLGYRF